MDINIGPSGTRRRRLMGVMMLVLGLAAAGFLFVVGVNPLWRLALLPVFWMAAFGLLQARAKT